MYLTVNTFVQKYFVIGLYPFPFFINHLCDMVIHSVVITLLSTDYVELTVFGSFSKLLSQVQDSCTPSFLRQYCTSEIVIRRKTVIRSVVCCKVFISQNLLFVLNT